MIDIGRLCVKIAGRDAGMKAVVVEKLDSNFVLIDGQVRRRKCNVKHLEPSTTTLSIKNKASHADIVKEFKKLKMDIKETKPKTKKTERPKRIREIKEKQDNKPQVKKKEEKKVTKKVVKKKK